MAIAHLMVLLLLFINYPGSDGFDYVAFQKEALAQHNYFRQLHCTPPMTLNPTIVSTAQAYAEYLASKNSFDHSGAPDLGENLWTKTSGAVITYINGSQPVNSWYNKEISLYDFGNPGYVSGAGHFTQVIWKNSVQLGIGIAFSTNQETAVVVANYYPKGNMQGSFADNVLPLCSGGVGGD